MIEGKAEEKTVNHSDRTMRYILEQAPIGIYLTDSEGSIEYFNPAMVKISGRSAENLSGLNIFKIHAYNQLGLDKKIRGVLNGEPFFMGPFEYTDTEAQKTTIRNVTGVPLEENGERKALLFVEDITEQKKTEDALRRSEERLLENEERFRQLYDDAPVGYHEFDIEGRITRVNKTELEMLGYTAEEMLGRYVWDFVEQKELARKTLTKRLKGALPLGQAFERNFIRKDGAAVPVLIHERRMQDDKGKIIGMRSTQQNITERKVLESHLLQAQKLEAIGQLAAGIAHEINTPIQYVGDNTRFLEDAFKDLMGLFEQYERFDDAMRAGSIPVDAIEIIQNRKEEIDLSYLMEEIPKAIRQTLDGANRVTEIVRAMKEFSHPGPKEKAPADLNRAIGNTITVARNEWKYLAEMVTDFDSVLPMVPCLPNEFNQVILNLVMNAVDAIRDKVGEASGEKGTIRISTGQIPDRAEVRISDTGTGIPPSVQSKIFEPFFTTKDVGKGTGQGLAIARSIIVDKHGGTIHFETDPGKGTTFIIRLPLEDESEKGP